MTSLFSYLITILGVVFWFFRAIVTLFYQLEVDFFATPLNVDLEIAVLFATLPCMLLVIKRNLIGATLYFAIYISYFGTALYNAVIEMQATGVTIVNSSNLICICLGVIIPTLTFLDILINKNRKGFVSDKKTEFDERADRNQYKL